MFTKEEVIKEIISSISSFFTNRTEDKFQDIKSIISIRKLEKNLSAELHKFFSQHEGSVVFNSGAFYQFMKAEHTLDRICELLLSSKGCNTEREIHNFVKVCCSYLKEADIVVNEFGRMEIRNLMLKLYDVGEVWLNEFIDPKTRTAIGIVTRDLHKNSDDMKAQLEESKEEILEKIEEGFRNSADVKYKGEAYREPDSSYDKLRELLKADYERNMSENPSMRLIKIDESIYPAGRIIHDVDVKSMDHEDAVQLHVFMEESWRNRQNHIAINGIGGIGKTVALFSINKKDDTPIVYIPLRCMVREVSAPIDDYMKRTVLTDKDAYDTFLNVCGRNWTADGPRLILLLDGMNEVRTAIREEILRELEAFFFTRPGIQIIMTSRYDIRSDINIDNMFYVELECLKRDKIKPFLTNNHVKLPEEASNIWSVIDTPLMLNLYAKSEIIKNREKFRYAFWRENANSGAIIWNYLQCEIYRCHHIHEKLLNCAIAANFIAPYIAFRMLQHECFELDIWEFDHYIQMAIHEYEAIDDKNLPKQIRLIRLEKTNESAEKLDKTKIYQLLTKDMCLFNEIDYRLQMMHQHFRDCFAALYLYQLAVTGNGHIPEEWRAPFDQYVMEFLADLLQTEGVEFEESTWNKIWLSTDGSLKSDRDFILKMLTLFKLAFGNNISVIDFSHRDLSAVPLTGYLLTDRSKQHFRNTILSENTFMGKGHTMTVCAVSWSPDNRYFLSSSYDCSLRIWDTANDVCDVLRGIHRHYIRCAAWNPRDKGIFASGGDDKKLIVWHDEEAKNDWVPHILGCSEDWIRSLAWSVDGNNIVCGDRSGNILLFNRTGLVRQYVKTHNDNVRCLSWDAENKMFASGSDDGTVCIWEKDSDHYLKKIPFNSPIVSVCWAGGAKYLIVAVESCVYIINFTMVLIGKEKEWVNKEEITCYAIQHEAISCAIVGTAIDREYLAVYYKRYVEVYSLISEETEFCPYLLAGGNSKAFNFNKIVSASWNRECDKIICGSRDGAVCKMSFSPAEENRDRIRMELVADKVSNSARCSAWSPDGFRLAVGYDDCLIRIWDLQSFCCVKVLVGHEDSVKCLVWSPDGQFLASGSDDAGIRIWDLLTAESIIESVSVSKVHTAPVNCLLWLKAGEKNGLIISGSDDKLLYLLTFSPDDQDPKGIPLSKHTNRIYSIVSSPDESLIVSGGNDRKLCLWNVEQQRCIQCIESGHGEPIRGLAWSGDGELIVSASNDCTLIYRKFNKNNRLMEESYTQLPSKHKDFIYNIAISGNQLYVVSASTDTDVGFWDMNKKELLTTGKEHLSFVWNISASSEIDHKYYVTSSSSDGIVNVWDVTHVDEEIHPCESLRAIPGIILAGCDFSEATIASEALRSLIKMNGGIL